MSLLNYSSTVKDRFLKYVKFNTQSDSHSESYPSTQNQLVLLEELKNELLQLGLEKVFIDEFGYLIATFESNTQKKVPTLAFFAHVDTASEVSGENVKPQVIEKYNGEKIELVNNKSQVLDPEVFPYLKNLKDHTLITTDGTTLLGADDKSGIAIIMDAISYLVQNPEIKHGKIKICFNPDEEVGQGTKFLNAQKIDADFGYTFDASDLGEIQYENFNADELKVTFFGKSIHPGYAKNKMVNAIKVASYFIDQLPKDKLAPEVTEKMEGFLHPTEMNAGPDEAKIEFILRDFKLENLDRYFEIIKTIATETSEKFGVSFEIERIQQYRNMKEIISKDMRVVDFAKEAMQRIGITTKSVPIRGGTDGATLTYKGLPCPNVFTGMQNYHGKLEYISVEEMQKSVETLVEIVKVWEEKS